jgi:hypothetical protein
MDPTLLARGCRHARCPLLLVLVLSATCSAASAQTSALGDAILTLWDGSVVNGTTQVVNGRLYGSTVNFQVQNNDDDDRNLGDADRVLGFRIANNRSQLNFVAPPGGATSDQFIDWAQAHASELLGYLFPTSLSQSVSGRDANQNFAQQFLLNTAMGISSARETSKARPETGALFEFENLSGDGRTGIAFQGLYRLEGAHMSVLGRYGQQRQAIQSGAGGPATETRSLTIATDFHPSAVVSPAVEWRVGIDARGGLLLSRADALNLGSLDYGGGVWTSARRDFSRVRVGFGSMLQGSKSYVPTSIVGDLKFLADAINQRPISWDLSMGAIGGYELTQRVSLNGKLLQTRPRQRDGEERPSTTVMMGSVSYLVGGLTPVDVGYKFSSGAGVEVHAVFLQGHFGW